MSCPSPSPSPRPCPGTTVPYLSSRCSLHPPKARSHSHTPRYPLREYIGKAKSPGEPAHALCSPKKSKSAVDCPSHALSILALQSFPAQARASDRSILISCRPLLVYAVAVSSISLVQSQIHLTAPQPLLHHQGRPTLARRLCVHEQPSPPAAGHYILCPQVFRQLSLTKTTH